MADRLAVAQLGESVRSFAEILMVDHVFAAEL